VRYFRLDANGGADGHDVGTPGGGQRTTAVDRIGPVPAPPNDNGYVGSVNKADGYMLDLGDSDVDFVPYRED